MGITFQWEGFLNAEHEYRRRLRHKNNIGRRGAALSKIPVAWLGRIDPFSAESPYPKGRGRGSDVSTPIGPTNASKSLQEDVAHRLFILSSLEQKRSFSS